MVNGKLEKGSHDFTISRFHHFFKPAKVVKIPLEFEQGGDRFSFFEAADHFGEEICGA